MSDFKKVLLSRRQIDDAVSNMGERLSRDYSGRELVVVCILKGAFVFCADLVRALKVPVRIDFLSASSYGNGSETSGNVQINKDLETDISGRDVLLVEDIIDSGLTLSRLKQMLQTRSPSSLKICCLLDKYERRQADIQPDYCCFRIPDEFVVGYGLDYASRYRNMPDIMVLDENVYNGKKSKG